MSKKFFIIITVVLVIFFLGLAGYYFFLQSNPSGTGNTPTSIFKNLFPFGQNTTSSTVTTSSSTPQTQPQSNYVQKLRKIWADPTAGFDLIDVHNAGTMVRHIDGATSHIYETDLFSPRQDEISDTTIPTAYNGYLGTDPNSVIAQYVGSDDQSVATYLLSITAKMATTSTGALIATNDFTTTATALPANIESFAISSTTLFYLVQNQYSSTGFVSSIAGGKQKQVWSSPITELSAQFVNGTTVALTTKPYQNVPGYVYFVNTTTGSVKEALGNIPGLSTLVSPDAKRVLALSQGGGTAGLFVDTIAGGATQTITPTTFPEKCVWSKKNTDIIYCAVPQQTLDDTSLTSWYMGTTQFTDDIWQFDLKANTGHIIENLSSDSGELIDVEKPALSPSEQYFVFINKRDSALWSLDLTK